jgi:hypothetical protein
MNFIPTIWSENLLQSLDQHYVGVANCSREYEGDIKEMGSIVKIPGLSAIDIKTYTANTDMEDPQDLYNFSRELKIDQAKYFHFQVDDVDRAQANPRLMDGAMRIAAEGLSKVADSYVFSLGESAGIKMEGTDITEANVMEYILKAREHLYRNGVLDSKDVVLEVSPAIATALIKAKIDLSTNNQELLENGCIGSIAGCKVFVSNNLSVGWEGEAEYFDCFMRTKRAISFAEQVSEIVAYCPEKRFADAIKGLHLYGAEVIYPNELVRLRLYLPAIPYEG